MSQSQEITVAAVQSAFCDERDRNVAAMREYVREAAARGAQVVLLPELFEGHYFPRSQRDDEFARALPVQGHPTIEALRADAAALGVVIPVSFFERDGQNYYNSLAMVDADGSLLGVYRTAPYLHHGKALTLRDVLTTCNQGDKHGKTSHLKPAEIDDLVAFLKSLPYEPAPAETPNTVKYRVTPK